jgi:hypothetical protein
MANSIKWKAIEHSQSKAKGKHVILVAYQSMGAGGLNKVSGVVPLYDIRDMNFDGSTSVLEKWMYDPYEVFDFISSTSQVSCVADAAIQMRDYDLYNKTIQGFLRATHKACSRMLTTIMVEKGISPGIELSLAETGLANLGKFSEVAQFIVQTALENVIIESICATHH